MKYEDNIVYQSFIDDSLLWCTNRAKRSIEQIKKLMTENSSVWVLKTYNPYVNFRSLVDCLYDSGLDIFDIEFDTITRIYIAKIDVYRIQNSVVYTLKDKK